MGRPWPRPGEPLWLEDDQDKVVAWLAVRHEVCPSCGTTESDWIDPRTRLPHDMPKWEATTYRCPGCSEIQQASAAVPDREAGVRIVLVPAKPGDDDEDD